MYDYDMLDYGYKSGSQMADAGIWAIVAFVIALIGGICLYFTVFSDKNESKYEGFMAKLYDFVKFKKLYISAFLKITYLILAIYITLYSFALISTSFIAFLLVLLLGNILLRFAYEFSLVLLGIYENTTEMCKKLGKK